MSSDPAVSSLPSRDSHSLRLAEGTPDELHAHQCAHFEQWGGALSREAYLRREKLLFSQELTANGNLTQYMLVYDLNDGSGKRQVTCGCECLKKRALVRRAGRGADVETAVVFGIASVFCPPPFRGRGYASRLMREVAARLRSDSLKRSQAILPSTNASDPSATASPSPDPDQILGSVLFSDIGKHFYAAQGWAASASAHIALAASASAPTNLSPIQDLQAADLPELCAADERAVRQRLARHDPSRTAVALLPDHATIAWHHSREEFIASELLGRKPEIKGAAVDLGQGKRVWCYWSHVWTNPTEQAEDTLHILRLAVEDDQFDDFAAATPAGIEHADESQPAVVAAIAALFAAAQREAARWDMRVVQLWNPSSTAVAAARRLRPDVDVVHRDEESIASLLWLGGGEKADVDWLCNEKFGWC